LNFLQKGDLNKFVAARGYSIPIGIKMIILAALLESSHRRLDGIHTKQQIVTRCLDCFIPGS